MEGKVVLVTGATSGIGLETALGLAKLGSTIAFTTRDVKRGEIAREYIVNNSNGKGSVIPYPCDLSSLSSIRNFVEEFHQEQERLDVLINNAGIVETKRSLTKEGVELTFAVNVLAPFLMTNLLLGMLQESAPSRIVDLSSGLHSRVRGLDLDDIAIRKNKFRSMDVYAESKLAMNLFTFELARRLEGKDITVNAVAPGWVATNLSRNSGWFSRTIMDLFASKPAKGALTSIYAASSPVLNGVTGKYLKDSSIAEPSPGSLDPEMARRLWDLCAAKTRME